MRDVRDGARSDQASECEGGEETQRHDTNEEEAQVDPSIVMSIPVKNQRAEKRSAASSLNHAGPHSEHQGLQVHNSIPHIE
jgi:hypothetical protein